MRIRLPAGTIKRLRALAFSLTVVLFALTSLSATTGEFSIPIPFLKAAAENVQIELNVNITGRSNVHPVASDCEMHFGAKSPDFDGDPSGLVLEPMNLCVEPPPAGLKSWAAFGNQVVKAGKARVRGVPRIWPEHLKTKALPSNPKHAVEIHPLTRIESDGTTRNFASFLYAPEGFEGGVGEISAGRMLTRTKVSVVANNGQAAITFKAPGTIGNFTVVEVTVQAVTANSGGHRVTGLVTVGQAEGVAVRMVTVAGSPLDKTISTLVDQPFSTLVLFALDPIALHDAAMKSRGDSVEVAAPIELILFGETEGT